MAVHCRKNQQPTGETASCQTLLVPVVGGLLGFNNVHCVLRNIQRYMKDLFFPSVKFSEHQMKCRSTTQLLNILFVSHFSSQWSFRSLLKMVQAYLLEQSQYYTKLYQSTDTQVTWHCCTNKLSCYKSYCLPYHWTFTSLLLHGCLF